MTVQVSAFPARCAEYRQGIPCENLQVVKTALKIFSKGRTRGSRATTDQLVVDGGFSGLMAAVFKEKIEERKESPFLQTLFRNIEAGIKQRGAYSYHYDYDGMGSFFKTTVEVKRVNDTLFILKLHAAYVGDKVEEGLAETLGLERALLSASAIVDLPAKDGRFTADMSVILGIVRKALPLKKLDGEIVKAITTVEDGAIWGGSPVIFENDTLAVNVKLASVAYPVEYKGREKTMTWKVSGTTITGPLHENFGDTPGFQTPQIVFQVYTRGKDKYELPALVKSEDKKVLLDLAEKIKAAFQ